MAALPGWEKPSEPVKLPLATQLFQVKELLDRDFQDTLKRVKEVGFDGVEFAGMIRHTAQETRYVLDTLGLQVAGWHVPWDALSPEYIHSTISYSEVIGNQFLIVPKRPDEVLSTRDGCLRFADELTWVSDVLGRHGMVTGYHNHQFEFRPTDDTKELPWDIIAQNTPSNVIMQNDIGNGMRGGGDLLGLLKKYPGRAVTVHMKPWSPESDNTFFDDPNCHIDWDEYFRVCRFEAGVRWYISEYGSKRRYPGDPIAAYTAAAKWFRGRGGK